MPTLLQALGLSRCRAVALVGSGGKTTLMFNLAQALAPVIVTTTTHLGAAQAALADRHLVWPEGVRLADLVSPGSEGTTLITADADPATARLRGLSGPQWADLLAWSTRRARPVLVEADGSRLRPLKAPAAHEPAIPADVDAVIVCAGLLGIGLPLDDQHVHRPAVFAALSGLSLGSPVTPEALAAVLAHPDGGRKRIPAGARSVAVLNQADTPALRDLGAAVARAIRPSFDAVVVTSLHDGRIDID
jgi:molybdenum cofactor cytidylyltransferase